MKKLILACVAAWTLCAIGIDSVTISRFEAKANERRLVSREMVVMDGVTNLVSTYRQSGHEWSVTNTVKHFTGVLAIKKYSRLKVYVACVRLGLWESLEAWLKTQTVDGINAYTAFMLANELAADDPIFMPMLEAAAGALGVGESTIQAVLAAAEM